MFKNKNIEIFFNNGSLGFYSIDLFCKIMKLILGRKLSPDSLNLCGFHTILADITRALKPHHTLTNKKTIIIHYIHLDKHPMQKLHS